jgi:hypothetical protein
VKWVRNVRVDYVKFKNIKSILIILALVGLPGRQLTAVKFKAKTTIVGDGVLESIFLHPMVKDRKIVTVSVIGAFRKGKSFLLDYFLRYLYHNVCFRISV